MSNIASRKSSSGSTTNIGNTHPTKNQKTNATKAANVNNNSHRNSDVCLSKSLSWVLRHAAPSVGLKLAPDGYVPLADLLALHHPRFRKDGKPKYTVEDVIRVVENNDKQRFRLEFKDSCDYATQCSGDQSYSATANNIDEGTRGERVLCIRANQGHSLKGLRSDQLLTPLTTNQLSHSALSIIHGTSQIAWENHIQCEGLSRRKRNHIHFATGVPPDKTSENDCDVSSPIVSGMRPSSEIYIYIDGAACANDNIPFYRSDNGVILTAGVNEDGMLPLKYFRKVVHASSGAVLWKKDDL